MHEINLLPWRSIQRKKRNNEFKLMVLISVSMALALLLMVSCCLNLITKKQLSRHEILQNEIKKLTVKLEKMKEIKSSKKTLLLRIKQINSINNNRLLTLRFFDEISKIIPPNIWLTDINKEGNDIVMSGKMSSHNSIDTMINGFSKIKWITNSKIIEIKIGDNKNNYDFKLKISINIS